MRQILKYIAGIITTLVISLPVCAQQEEKTDSIPLWNGFRVELDVASPVLYAMGLNEWYTTEGALQVNLKYKYFPVIELGVSGLSDKQSVTGATFNANGMYGRFGTDINLLKYKNPKYADNLFLVGGRIGMSSFSYDLMNVTVTDDYWGVTEVRNYQNMPVTKFWFEIVASMRVMVSRNVFLGWSIRSKNRFGTSTDSEVSPFFIPGYGNAQSSNWAFNYVIGYKF